MTIPQAFELGVQHYQSGRLAEAEGIFRQILAVDPRHAESLHILGAIAYSVGRKDAAVDLLRQAIAARPNFPEACSNLGMALQETGAFDQAIAACKQAIGLRPDYAEAHHNLGSALYGRGQVDDAIAAYRRAIALKPDYAAAQGNLGCALQRNGQIEDAIAAYRQAIALLPGYPEAHSNLGSALVVRGKWDEAIAAYRQAIALKPNFPDAHNNLGSALKEKGLLDEAIASNRQAISLKPDFPDAHSNLLYALHFQPGSDAVAIAEEHRAWNRQHAGPLRQCIQPHPNDRSPGRRLRIGYVSPDFREHSVAYLVENLFAFHDSSEVEVFCYSNLLRGDFITARLRALVSQWREIFTVPDAQVAEMIRMDRIDILVDLTGHTAGNRLPVFARKPAPLQVTWLGYPDTTGMEAMDCRFTDAFADPPGTTAHLHSEELVFLPECAWCFRPLDSAPPVSAPPVMHAGCVTFGSFNAQPKISAPMLTLWSEILRAVPGSRLLLKNRALQEASTRDRVLAELKHSGVAPDRIEMTGYAATLEGHLASYGRVDVALDTFPYHGTITTCEALWMGVPVVSLAGATHAARVGVSLLSNVGLPELVATSEEEYIQLAVGLANDPARLAAMRPVLREKMKVSPLMDAPRFARNVEQAYRQMWRTWCAKQPPLPAS